MRINIKYCWFVLCLAINSCAQTSNKNVEFFKDTPAYELAIEVQKGNLKKIEEIVKENPDLMDYSNPETGSNVLMLSIYVENFKSFKKLLELGANPNYINPKTKYSVLMESIIYFGSSLEWREDNRYAELLLNYKADPNYAVENDFVNQDNNYVTASSPLLKASRINLSLVKLLIKYGADPYKKLGETEETPFSSAVARGKFDIVNYYIDSLKFDVHQPMKKVIRKPKNELVTFYVQDYVVNNLMYQKLKDSSVNVDKDKERWELIEKLEAMGVDFRNYDYKKNYE